MQLAVHLRGRALQEWNLTTPEDKTTYEAAVNALQAHLDPGNCVLAAQDLGPSLIKSCVCQRNTKKNMLQS